MALTEDSVIDSINVKLDGAIEVRKANRVFRDGEEISKSYHRHVVSPGDDLSLEDPKVAAVGAAIHTPEVIAAFKDAQNAMQG